MLFLLRNIRRKLLTGNKVTTYLLYAIGEIFLVVVGILIAVQLDNWNDTQNKTEEVNRIIQEVHDNLLEDQQYLETTSWYNKATIALAQSIELNHNTLTNDSLYKSLIPLHSVIFFFPVRIGFEKLSGYSTSNILPDSLSKKLTIYYAEYNPDAGNNTNYEGLSKYSLDHLRDYLIRHKYPINSMDMKGLAPPTNIDQLKEIVGTDEFIGILRNLQHSRIVQQSGIDDATKQVLGCLELTSAYLNSINTE